VTESLSPVSVYLVDDESNVTEALVWLLESVGIRACACNSASAFLRALPGINGPICAVLDLRMPEMGGLELQRRMIAEGYDIPIIFLTAHGEVPAAVSAIKKGAVNFIEKPFNPEDFLANVNQLIHLARQKYALKVEMSALRERCASLSKRESDVLNGLLNGLTSKELAHLLKLSPKTVDTHRTNIMRKLGVTSRSEMFSMLRTQDGHFVAVKDSLDTGLR
jgi:FixJ family two-component response regulator